MNTAARSRTRSAARLAAVQALYQQEMEGTPTPTLLHEFHQHRFGQTIDDVTMIDAEMDFFDDLVRGVTARAAEIDGLVSGRLAEGWKLERLDRSMRAILRAGTYELVARPDVTVGLAHRVAPELAPHRDRPGVDRAVCRWRAPAGPSR